MQPTPLEIQLKAILDSKVPVWTIQTLFQALKGKGYPFLIVLLSLPFCQPLQIPGFSTPFGIAIIFIGLRMAFGRHIWWPKWVLEQKISPRLLKTVIQKSLGFFRFLRPLLFSRWTRVCTDPFFYRLHGCFVSLMGLYLALPLPIPLSNLVSAWALLLMGLGLMEEDGVFVSLSYGLGCLALVILIVLIMWLRAWAIS